MSQNTTNIFRLNGRRYLFIHIPKTAGTSVVSSLSKYEGVPHRETHILPSKYVKNIWEKLYTFAIIRNPYERMVSHWLYHTTSNYKGTVFINSGISKNIDNISFEEYVRIVKKIHKTCVNFYPETSEPIDRILRFENLTEDWNKLCNKIGISCELQNKKATNHVHYSKYYTDLTRKTVKSMYSSDLKKFGYTFKHE